jgi:glycosyltransferase involved in cell wall biosynthesis
MPPWLLVAGDFRSAGGMDRANYELAWHLAERLGRSVWLVAHRVAEPLAHHPLVQTHLVPRPLGWHLLGGPLLDRAGRRLASRLRAARPDTRVLVNGGNCLTVAANWVHMVHRACPCADSGAPWAFRLKHRLLRACDRWRERRALARCPLVIANSKKTRRELIDQVGVPAERIGVVYLGTDPAEFRPATDQERREARAGLGLPESDPVFLFVGALGHDRNKGFDTLLGSLACASGSWWLLAAGGGRLRSWRRQADRLGLGERVRLVGHTERMATLMAAADVLVSPTRYDAYGLAVHEALCCGLPALVSRAAGIAERYPPELSHLLLDDPEDGDELARRLARCARELAEARRRMAPYAETLRARTWAAMAQEIVDLVEGDLP